jgi:NADPH-dependent 2,4-dienoyl-CoA reductase/sulfur reductase-like enzyme
VVVGASFIGMEVSSVLAKGGVKTTVVFPQERVWHNFFTPPMSEFFQKYCGKRGVTFCPHEKAKAFIGSQRVRAVQLESGRELPADFVVAGIGVVPGISLFQNTKLKITDGIAVSECLETNVPGVYAAGDVANYPDRIFHRRRRLEHWDNAVEQGRCAVRNLMAKPQPFIHVPYYFSDLFDLSFEFWGDSAGSDRVVYRGSVRQGRFSVWWLNQKRLVAAFVLNRPDEERELAPKWILEKPELKAGNLEDSKRSIHTAF